MAQARAVSSGSPPKVTWSNRPCSDAPSRSRSQCSAASKIPCLISSARAIRWLTRCASSAPAKVWSILACACWRASAVTGPRIKFIATTSAFDSTARSRPICTAAGAWGPPAVGTRIQPRCSGISPLSTATSQGACRMICSITGPSSVGWVADSPCQPNRIRSQSSSLAVSRMPSTALCAMRTIGCTDTPNAWACFTARSRTDHR